MAAGGTKSGTRWRAARAPGTAPGSKREMSASALRCRRKFLRFFPGGFADETYAVLRERTCALCVADTDDGTTPLVATAPFGYVRLRRLDYTPEALAEWAARLRDTAGWKRAYVYVKHDEAGRAPALAQALLGAFS